MLNGGAISWCSRLQPTTALSATEAEYMAVSSAAQELTSLRYVLEAIAPSSVTDPTVICEDNQGAIFIAENPVKGSSPPQARSQATPFHPRLHTQWDCPHPVHSLRTATSRHPYQESRQNSVRPCTQLIPRLIESLLLPMYELRGAVRRPVCLLLAKLL
jgi:hypothetical protein